MRVINIDNPTTPVVIDITTEDIQTGRSRNCFHCPGALAIKRHLHPGWEVSVGDAAVSFRVLGFDEAGNYHSWQRVETPRALTHFIHSFDKEYPRSEYRPVSFILDIPVIALRSEVLL